MMRNRKVWGVLGLLLALVVVVGYGQPQPVIDPLAKLAAYPQELVGLLSQVIPQFTRVLEGTQININNAAMWVGILSPGQPIGVIIIAPPARLSLRPGAAVGLIGLHNMPFGTTALPAGYYAMKLPPETIPARAINRLLLVDQAGRQVGVLAIKIPFEPDPRVLAAASPRVHMSMGLQDAVPPGYPALTAKICIGWKRANCDCIGIHIEL